MPNNAGIFSLSTHYNKNLSLDISSRTRESYSEYGYLFSGRNRLANFFPTNIERKDYSTDTTTNSNRGFILAPSIYTSVVGNSNFAYHSDDYGFSRIYRLNYLNDTASVQFRCVDSILNRRGGNVGGTKDYGWFIAGATSKISRINYSDDTVPTLIRGNDLVWGIRGTSGQNINYAWSIGGDTASLSGGGGFATSTIRRFNYSNDLATVSSRGSFLFACRLNATTGNENFGYVSGGQYIPPFAIISTTGRITYVNDLVFPVIRGSLSAARGYLSASGTSSFGYYSGGVQINGGVDNSIVERLDYSNDTNIMSIRGPLFQNRNSTQANITKGSFGGASVSQYSGAGRQSFFDNQRMKSPSDTTSYSVRKNALLSYGYFGGGLTAYTPSVTNTSCISRLQYSTDTLNIPIRSSIALGRRNLASSSNKNFGYHYGGFAEPATLISNIDRIQYSNDTLGSVDRAKLVTIRHNCIATGSNQFSYIMSGTNTTTIERYNYSNDNLNSTQRGNGSILRNSACGLGILNFGYTVGGNSASYYSIVDRINYSNDLATASVRGNITLARRLSGASGNLNFGYVAGGTSGSNHSTIDRIDYSNDTTISITRGTLSGSTYASAATGTSNFGYFSGGRGVLDGLLTRVERIDYANDTNSPSIRGPLSFGVNSHAATTNSML